MAKELSTSMALAVPQGNIDAYIHAVNSIPVLSFEEEQELAKQYHYDGDLSAARQLVLSHLRFVVHIARSYSGYGLPIGDLIQEGNVGLMKAVKRFDPAVGVRLVSFAVHWIKAEIHEFVLRNWRIVKVATTKAQRKLFFNLRSAKKHLGWLNSEETQKVAADLGVSVEEVQRMEGRLNARDLGFDVPVSEDDDTSAPAYYLEDKSSDPALQIEQDNWSEHHNQKLMTAFSGLDQRSQDILQKRWLSEEKATLQELANTYQVSAERIRQLEKNAMKKLKEGMLTAA